MFVKLIKNRNGLSDTPSVKGYLLKAFRHHLYDALRKKRIHDELFLPCIDDILLFEQNSSSPNQDDSIQESIIAVRSAFQKLSPHQQEILYLYYVTGVSHTEIATTLNINYQSSKNLLFRSLSKLKMLFVQEMKNIEESADAEKMLNVELGEYHSTATLY